MVDFPISLINRILNKGIIEGVPRYAFKNFIDSLATSIKYSYMDEEGEIHNDGVVTVLDQEFEIDSEEPNEVRIIVEGQRRTLVNPPMFESDIATLFFNQGIALPAQEVIHISDIRYLTLDHCPPVDLGLKRQVVANYWPALGALDTYIKTRWQAECEKRLTKEASWDFSEEMVKDLEGTNPPPTLIAIFTELYAQLINNKAAIINNLFQLRLMEGSVNSSRTYTEAQVAYLTNLALKLGAKI